MKRLIVFLIPTLLLASCALTPKYSMQGWKPKVIAVLPFTNQSADVAFEKFARQVMMEELVRGKYQVVDLDKVDMALDKLGVTEAGQLSTVSSQELADAIPADSYLYGDILEAKRILLGIYFEKKVHVDFKITNTSGTKMWEDERTSGEKKIVYNPKDILEASVKEFAYQAGSDLFMKALNSHPLIQHLRAVTQMSVSTLPR